MLALHKVKMFMDDVRDPRPMLVNNLKSVHTEFERLLVITSMILNPSVVL